MEKANGLHRLRSTMARALLEESYAARICSIRRAYRLDRRHSSVHSSGGRSDLPSLFTRGEKMVADYQDRMADRMERMPTDMERSGSVRRALPALQRQQRFDELPPSRRLSRHRGRAGRVQELPRSPASPKGQGEFESFMAACSTPTPPNDKPQS